MVRTAFDRYRLAGARRGETEPPEPVDGGYVIVTNAEGESAYVVSRDGARVRYARR